MFNFQALLLQSDVVLNLIVRDQPALSCVLLASIAWIDLQCVSFLIRFVRALVLCCERSLYVLGLYWQSTRDFILADCSEVKVQLLVRCSVLIDKVENIITGFTLSVFFEQILPCFFCVENAILIFSPSWVSSLK